ncbi:MAG TPA: copper transporter [Syntrophomonadaceae bacterium]|nr:copper transporter [Syntrophomonadaceae bacterium]
MIIDIKYHIASLTAVFLALGIGILIGTSMIGSDTITKQQKNMIDGIEKEFTILREENKQNTDALLQAQDVMLNQQQFNQAVMPLLVRNKLQGRKIALVDVNYNRDHDGLANVLRSSGADVQSITAVNLAVLKDQNISKQTAGMLGKSKDADPEKYLSDLARLTAEAIASGENNDLVRFLDDNNVVKISGVYGPPLQDVILIGGTEKKDEDYFKKFDQVMIKDWKKAGLNVYGVEDSDTAVSYMRYYQSARLTTVDNIDTVYGQVSLVMAMYGYPGHYGIKQTADAFIPPLE